MDYRVTTLLLCNIYIFPAPNLHRLLWTLRIHVHDEWGDNDASPLLTTGDTPDLFLLSDKGIVKW